MEEIEQQIIDSLSEVRNLIANYKSIDEEIKKEKIKLSYHAKHIQKERALCEQDAMFFEDCIGHAPSKILNFYDSKISNKSLTKETAKNNLMKILEQSKLNEATKNQNQKMNAEIDEMMEKISFQHQLLKKEETVISELKEKEAHEKQLEAEQFQALLKKLNDSADEFQRLHNTNKAKKEQLLKIENSNAELKEKIEETKINLRNSNESLKQAKQFALDLAGRRQNSQTRSIQITQKENKLNTIRNENSKLSREEIKLNEIIGQLSVEYEGQKATIHRIFSRIENIEQYIESKINENSSS